MESTSFPLAPSEELETNSALEAASSFELNFTGKVTEEHVIPALVLALTIEALQKSVYILAMEKENRVVRERARVPSAIEQKYVVRCKVPTEGSYKTPFVLGDPNTDLFAVDDIAEVSGRLKYGFSVFTSGQFDLLRKIVPDRGLLARLLEQFRSLIPRPGTGVSLDIEAADGTKFIFAPRLLAELRQYLVSLNTNEESIQTVTGRLERIDFGEHKITLIYPSNNRALDCFYDETAEGTLLENPRELIQVTGRVIFDDTGLPIKILDVDSILEVDLSPILLTQIEWQERVLTLRVPITLTPELDESSQLLQVRYEPFDLYVFAQTRDQLWAEINEFIDMLWVEYALEEDANLSEPAIALKEALRANLEVSQ